MSNTYFRFKQFTIHQDSCAMKVSTDACIAGAWTDLQAGTKRVLDIGTGTGLLALMLAQRYKNILIEAIELDSDAAEQAKENVALSSWANRINVIHGDASDFKKGKSYDFIISNPPFFNNSLLSDIEERNMARHTGSLSYANLFSILKNNLSDNGYASILLPVTEHMLWENILLENNWVVCQRLYIYPAVGKPANRIVSICARPSPIIPTEEHLFIRKADGTYTSEFMKLMESYYLDK